MAVARDAQHAGHHYVVSARRTGATNSTSGIDGLVAGVRLLTRWVRRDHRYEVLVWDREKFPFLSPLHVRNTSNRAEALALVDQVVARIADAGVDSAVSDLPGPGP